MRQFAIGVAMSVGLAVAIAAQGPAAMPFQEEEVTFTNGDVKLAGTLTMPSTGPPRAAVVLLTGSGAQNRDEELFGFRPFKVIADHLGKAGLAVLRYDDRGVGGSTGNVARSTTHAFAGDAAAALALMKSRLGAATPVGFLGHSEGALVAAIAAAAAPRDVSFIVMMAGPGERGDAVLRRQTEDLLKAAGASDAAIARILAAHRKVMDAVASNAERPAMLEALRGLVRAQLESAPGVQGRGTTGFEALVDKSAERAIPTMTDPWFRAFVVLDPAESLSKVTAPALVLFGERDIQVPPAANRPLIEAALAAAKNNDVTVKVYPEANHLFIKSVTGSPSEYPTLEKTFVPGLLDDVATWVLQRAKR